MVPTSSLSRRVSQSLFLIGLVPAIILALVNLKTLKDLADTKGAELVSQSITLGELINRNLFERYGDVQAFGYNQAIHDRESWYKVGSEVNQIAKVMNDYVKSYGVYTLSVLVDLNGQVIAVNDRDATGEKIDSKFLYAVSFKDHSWVKDAIEGRFYTEPGMITGSVVEDAYFDPIVKQIYEGDGYTLGFAAPVRDAEGKTIAVWKNFTNFNVIEEILWTSQKSLKKYGYPRTDFVLIGKDGIILAQSDHIKSDEDKFERSSNIGQDNLVENGLHSDLGLAENISGLGQQIDPDSRASQLVAFSRLEPTLGFKGMQWSALIKVNRSDVLADLIAIERILFGLLVATIGVLIFCTRKIAKLLVTPLQNILEEFKKTSELLDSSSVQILDLSQDLAAGSTEQAAAIQESVASMTEMSGMISQTSDLTQRSRVASSKMAEGSQIGAATMQNMVRAMETIQASNAQLQNMVDVISQISSKTAVINDIVFKTQLLSFNASIEAARAGQHGRGFAVVAEEVGHLAELSGHAAKEIESLIDQSKKEVSQIVEMTLARVTEGHRVSNESLNIFSKLTSSISEVDNQIEGIAQATKEQNLGIKQSSIALSEMDNIAQKTRDIAQEASSCSVQLGQENQKLKFLLASFDSLLNGRKLDAALKINSKKEILDIRPVERKAVASSEVKPKPIPVKVRKSISTKQNMLSRSPSLKSSPVTEAQAEPASSKAMPPGEATDIAERLIKKKAEGKLVSLEDETPAHSLDNFTPMT